MLLPLSLNVFNTILLYLLDIGATEFAPSPLPNPGKILLASSESIMAACCSVASCSAKYDLPDAGSPSKNVAFLPCSTVLPA